MQIKDHNLIRLRLSRSFPLILEREAKKARENGAPNFRAAISFSSPSLFGFFSKNYAGKEGLLVVYQTWFVLICPWFDLTGLTCISICVRFVRFLSLSTYYSGCDFITLISIIAFLFFNPLPRPSHQTTILDFQYLLVCICNLTINRSDFTVGLYVTAWVLS